MKTLAITFLAFAFSGILVGIAFGNNYSFSIKPEQQSVDGVFEYYFGLDLTHWQEGNVVTVTAPNGLTADNSGVLPGKTNCTCLEVFGMTLNELNSGLTGVWEMTEQLASGVVNRYEFEVPAIRTSDFLEPPVLVSPADNSTVDPVFQVEWTGELDQMLGLSYFDVAGNFMFPAVTVDGNMATVDYTGDPDFPGLMLDNFRVISQHIDRGAIEPVGVTPGADSSFNFNFLTYRSASPPTRLTVVPEPSCDAILLVMASLGLFFKRAAQRVKVAGP